MVTPVSSRGNCPQCGAQSQLYDARCWLCGWSPAVPREADLPVVAPPIIVRSPPTHELEPLQFSIGGLLVVTTVIAVCLGALRVAPGLGIMLLLLFVVGVVPATIRARVVRKRMQGDDSPRGTSERRLAYLASFAIVVAAITAGLVTCAVVAFAAFLVACSDLWGRNPNAQTLVSVLLFGSPVIGLIVAGLIYWLAWPQAPSSR
jgi:hypothetical protein